MQVLSVVLTQFIVAYLVKDWAWWKLWIVAYIISGTLNQNLFCAQHEISHCLAFRKPFHNRVLAIIGNLPLVVPVANKFREYHHDHHLFLGVDGGDVDLPTVLEAKWISSTLAKAIYGFFYLVVYGVRPLIVRPKPATFADVVNWVVVMACNGLVLWGWGFKSLIYLLAGSILGGGLHPLAGHLIAEHYMFEPGQETYSYYGPLNVLSYNVGFHNEHHDFPQIPQTRLYRLKEIAPEYYKPLYQHMSWCWVIWKFLTDPTIGPWSRMHRETRAGTPEANAAFARGNCLKGILDDDVDVSVDGVEGRIHSSTESAAEDSAGEESGGPTTRQKIVKTANRKHFRNDSAAESVPAK
jgi:sphingolipid delta-4 desaturase